jgi:hypothetical protein
LAITIKHAYRAIEQLEDIAVPQALKWELVASTLFPGEGVRAFKESKAYAYLVPRSLLIG